MCRTKLGLFKRHRTLGAAWKKVQKTKMGFKSIYLFIILHVPLLSSADWKVRMTSEYSQQSWLSLREIEALVVVYGLQQFVAESFEARVLGQVQ